MEADHCSECTICFCAMDGSESIVEFPCRGKHLFHQGCLKTWLAGQHGYGPTRYIAYVYIPTL